MELVSILLNFLLASGLAGTLVFFNSKRRRERAAADSAELENTEKVVAIQSEQITRLDGRVEKLEEKVDKLSKSSSSIRMWRSTAAASSSAKPTNATRRPNDVLCSSGGSSLSSRSRRRGPQ